MWFHGNISIKSCQQESISMTLELVTADIIESDESFEHLIDKQYRAAHWGNVFVAFWSTMLFGCLNHDNNKIRNDAKS